MPDQLSVNPLARGVILVLVGTRFATNLITLFGAIFSSGVYESTPIPINSNEDSGAH